MEFYRLCKEYLREMQSCKDFNEISRLWRATSIPYEMPRINPVSDEYRTYVLEIYREIAQKDYFSQNELTSSKQPADSFRMGYPWTSKDCLVAASELAKTVQALNALGQLAIRSGSIVEFGSGWGNLVIPLVKLGFDVTAVDIDPAFLDRMMTILARDSLHCETFLGDFIASTDRFSRQYDVAIFQSSFHHCLEFDSLFSRLSTQVLKGDGCIIFLSEPIFKDYAFPWGLRFDGESLWAIMCNHWLELGFDEDFFIELALRHGFFLSRISGISGLVGEGWLATRCQSGLSFADCSLPSKFHFSFWERDTNPEYGRFVRSRSSLPILPAGRQYILTLRNYCTKELKLCLRGDDGSEKTTTLSPGGQQEITAPTNQRSCLSIDSETVVPDLLIKNNDQREIGPAILNLATT